MTSSGGGGDAENGPPSLVEKMYGIGESVYVRVDGKHYSGIVKNVDYGSDADDGGGGDDDDEKDGDNGGKISYEVEFSDGEIWDVGPENMFEDEDD